MLARIANDADVTRYMSPGFPYPYRLDDAVAWVEQQRRAEPQVHFAIECGGALTGGIGLTLGTVEHRGSAMVGYFLAKDHWGRGVATDAVRAITAYGLTLPDVSRLWANVMGPNAASMRVLEKAGYHAEAILHMALVDRYGNRHDEHIYTWRRPQ